MNAPDPRLRGASPAEELRKNGSEGLQTLLAGLALAAPSRPDGPIDMPPLEDLRIALARGMGEETAGRIARIAGAAPTKLDDAQMDAELASVK